MKIKNKKKYVALGLFSLLFGFLPVMFAKAIDYVPLQPGAFGPGSETINTGNLSVFLGSIFNLGIAIAAGLAVIMIIWGGIEYMTTESWGGKGDAKKRINDALIGLGLALVSWLLLYTINPCLVQFTASTNCPQGNTFLNLK
jgi:hypothetical protein